MNKKFLSVILFSALMLGSTGVFTSCKDYDDDIKDLKGQLDKKASLEDLNAKVSTLQTAVNEAKTAASEAKTKAQEAYDKAKEALDKAGTGSGADVAALRKAMEDADAALQAEVKKMASLDAVNEKITNLKNELKADFVTDDKLKALAADVDALSAQVMSLIGHRLTTLAVIPTSHVNGIAAITLTTLQYAPQKYLAHTTHQDPTSHVTNPVLDHVSIDATTNYISTDNNEAYFHVSPSLGVRNEDIKITSFDCIQSENILTRATGADIANNSPIAPVTYDINKGVMTVKFKKTVTGTLGAVGSHATGKETFYMASLKASLAETSYTDAEKQDLADGKITDVSVNSEYVRIHEEVKAPYLTNIRTDFGKTIAGDFADETQTDANGSFYVHYHDSVCVYNSQVNQLIDVKQSYNVPLDLKKLVKVCVTDVNATTHNNAHANLANYKEYGLTFRFYIPTTPYNTLGGADGNTNKTDQQKFAKLDSYQNGIMSSSVYGIDGSATAVGREPIVRVELVDTVNHALVAMRYIKIKWVKEAGERPLSHAFADSIYYCSNYTGRIGTQEMNVSIYDKAKEGGMTKQEFHSVYTDGGFNGTSGAGEGVAAFVKNSQSGVESYNIIWTLTHRDIVTKYPKWDAQEKMDFSKVIFWNDPTGAYPTLKITLTRTIYKPAFNLWGFDGRYWKNDNNWNVFNVNPIVYDTDESNPAWGNNTKNNPTCNIYTDLLNGFLDDKGYKPTTGAGGAVWYSDKANAAAKFYYSALYPTTAAGTNLGTKAGAYAEEGVRFIFDKEKLEAANTSYKYQYFNGTSVVEKTATVSPDGTILYINGEKAATIVNFVDNNLKPGEMTYNIKLEEANASHNPRTGDAPTEAAKAIVGKNVPVKMVADLCYDDACQVTAPLLATAHTATIKAYDAFIIEPLTVTTGTTENFTDATVGGSTIDVKGAFAYVSWNADKDGKKYIVSNAATATALQRALWEFYEVVPGQWMTGEIKSNLKLVNGNLVPTAGVENGPLPSNTKVTYDTANETLTYNNYSGTPVNWDYKLYIPVKFGYKWKTFTMTFIVDVKKNAGTPAGN